MRIHYTIDDSAARLPLAIRSSDAVWDRAADLRNSPGIHLVELTTQHMLAIGTTLVDELANFYDNGQPSESDPYALAHCYANRAALEDLLRDVREAQPGVAALHEVAEMFPLDLALDLSFMLALTVVGYPAFGYVRTYRDSERDEYHGLVVNLAQAQPHLEELFGHFSLERLINLIRHGFFNHEGFLVAYEVYSEAIGRRTDRAFDPLKDDFMKRGIAWYLSYRHDLATYDEALGLGIDRRDDAIAECNAVIANAGAGGLNDPVADGLEIHESRDAVQQCMDVAGYHVARAIAEAYGDAGLRACIVKGADHFIEIYNALDVPKIRFPGTRRNRERS